jgi:hypothetical protein
MLSGQTTASVTSQAAPITPPATPGRLSTRTPRQGMRPSATA